MLEPTYKKKQTNSPTACILDSYHQCMARWTLLPHAGTDYHDWWLFFSCCKKQDLAFCEDLLSFNPK
jgi:hypothetical protein